MFLAKEMCLSGCSKMSLESWLSLLKSLAQPVRQARDDWQELPWLNPAMRQAYDYWQEVPWPSVLTRVQKLPTTQERICVLGVYPSPAGAVPRYYPYAKVISSEKSPFAQRVPPPSRGRSPLLPVCKSYQQCARPTAGPSSEVLGYIYLLIQGSTAPEPPLAVGRQVIACLFYCSPGICS